MIYWLATFNDGSYSSQLRGLPFDSIDRKNLRSFKIIFGNNQLLNIGLSKGDIIAYRKRHLLYEGVNKIIHVVYHKSNTKVMIYFIDENGSIKTATNFSGDGFQHKIEFNKRDLVPVG